MTEVPILDKGINDWGKDEQEEAEEILSHKERIEVEDVDDYGETFRETIKGKHVNDLSGDEHVEWKKIDDDDIPF